MIRVFLVLFLLYQATSDSVSQKSIGNEIDSLIEEARDFKSENNYDKSILTFKEALSISLKKGDSLNISKIQNYLAITYRKINDKASAIQFFYKAIEVNKLLKNQPGLVVNYVNLANYYNGEENYKLAFTYYKLAEKTLRINPNPKYLANISLNLATLFSYDSSGFYNYDSAVYYNLKSLDLYKKLEDTLNISFLYNNLGYLFEKSNNYKAALTNYEASANLKSEINDSTGLAIVYLNLGNVYSKLEQFKRSLEYYERSKDYSSKNLNPAQDLYVLFNLMKVKMALGQVEQASDLLIKYNALRDSIYDKEKMQEVKDLETKYETAKKEEEIKLQEMAIREKTFQSNLFLSLSILLIILIVSAVFFFLQKQEYVKKLKNEEIASMRREQELKELSAMMHGQEEERNRIANDLHDRLGARLSSIKLMFQTEDSPDIKFKVLNSINEAIKETREISHNLSTDMLTRFGIETAIKDIIRSINDSGQINADFVSYGLQQRLPLEVERNIYHVTLELINNTLKHANANNIMIQISFVDNEINVFYEDDGDGFEINGLADTGMGLRGIYARMNSVQGVANVNSKPGHGINVVLSIPLNAETDTLITVKKEKLA